MPLPTKRPIERAEQCSDKRGHKGVDESSRVTATDDEPETRQAVTATDEGRFPNVKMALEFWRDPIGYNGGHEAGVGMDYARGGDEPPPGRQDGRGPRRVFCARGARP